MESVQVIKDRDRERKGGGKLKVVNIGYERNKLYVGGTFIAKIESFIKPPSSPFYLMEEPFA